MAEGNGHKVKQLKRAVKELTKQKVSLGKGEKVFVFYESDLKRLPLGKSTILKIGKRRFKFEAIK